MNFVLGIAAMWAAAALFYLAVDPTLVQASLSGKSGQAGQRGLGHGDLWSLYTGLLSPFSSNLGGAS